MELSYPFPDTPPAGTLTAIAPGVHWLRMPLPFALDHINLWLLEDGDGVVIVDTGYAADATREAWQTILSGRTIKRIVATHFHPDHLGLASWLQAQSGAPVLMSQGEYTVAQLVFSQIDGYGVPAMLDFFRRHGLDLSRLNGLDRRGNAYSKGVPALPTQFSRLITGDRLPVGNHEWEVISGYGHSPEHVSLHCPDLGLLISGDMLLPRITTNVSVWAATPDDDVLGLFLQSIQHYNTLPPDTLVLPSHGLPFRGITGRITQLQDHHAARCEELRAACMESPRTAADLLPVLFSRDISDPHQTMFAMGEVIAHVNHLVHLGHLSQLEDEGILRYRARR